MELSLIKQEISSQLADKEVVQSLLATTFKGLSVENMKAAVLEGMIRGFSFKDFLEKNVYAIKYGQGYSLVTSIDNNRKIGMRSGIVGTDAPIYLMSADKTEAGIPRPDSCSITVHRMINGHVGDFTAYVFFDEYYKAGKTWEGKYTPSMWDTKPRTMLAKVAEMHALRKACPEELSQAYVEEELREDRTIHIDPITVESCTETLLAATSLNELRDAWAKVPQSFQPQLLVMKDEMKKKLSPAPAAAAPALTELQQLENDIMREEAQINAAEQFPTDTDQFRAALQKNKEKLAGMKEKLESLKAAAQE